MDTAAIFSKLAGEILEIVPPEGTNMAASFGHLGGGYDARYYGYMVRTIFYHSCVCVCVICV